MTAVTHHAPARALGLGLLLASLLMPSTTRADRPPDLIPDGFVLSMSVEWPVIAHWSRHCTADQVERYIGWMEQALAKAASDDGALPRARIVNRLVYRLGVGGALSFCADGQQDGPCQFRAIDEECIDAANPATCADSPNSYDDCSQTTSQNDFEACIAKTPNAYADCLDNPASDCIIYAPRFKCYMTRPNAVDPLVRLSTWSRERGMQFYVYMDLFDAQRDPWIGAHPEFSPQTRAYAVNLPIAPDTTRYGNPRSASEEDRAGGIWWGMPSFAYRQVRERYGDLVVRLLTRYRDHIDGIIFSTESHHGFTVGSPSDERVPVFEGPPTGSTAASQTTPATALRGTAPRADYGFNAPIRDRVLDEDGLDIWDLAHQEIATAPGLGSARAAWRRAAGAFVVETLQELTAIIKGVSSEIAVGYMGHVDRNQPGQQLVVPIEDVIATAGVDEVVLSRSRTEYLFFERDHAAARLRSLVALGAEHGVRVHGLIFADVEDYNAPIEVVAEEFSDLLTPNDLVRRSGHYLTSHGAHGLHLHDLELYAPFAPIQNPFHAYTSFIEETTRAALEGALALYGGDHRTFRPGLPETPAEYAPPGTTRYAIFVNPAQTDAAFFERFGLDASDRRIPFDDRTLRDHTSFFKHLGVALAEVSNAETLDLAWRTRETFDLLILSEDAIKRASWLAAWLQTRQSELATWIDQGGTLVVSGDSDGAQLLGFVTTRTPLQDENATSRRTLSLADCDTPSNASLPCFSHDLLRVNQLGHPSRFARNFYEAALPPGFEVLAHSSEDTGARPVIVGARLGQGRAVFSAAALLNPINLETLRVLGPISPELVAFWRDVLDWLPPTRSGTATHYPPRTMMPNTCGDTWDFHGSCAARPGEFADRVGGHLWSSTGRYVPPSHLEADTSWEFSVQATGLYRVSTWIPTAPADAARNVRWHVRSAAGEHTITLDHESHTNRWALLNFYPFKAGETYTITQTTGGAYGRLSCGAVQLSRVKPVRPIRALDPRPADIVIGFKGAAGELGGLRCRFDGTTTTCGTRSADAARPDDPPDARVQVLDVQPIPLCR